MPHLSTRKVLIDTGAMGLTKEPSIYDERGAPSSTRLRAQSCTRPTRCEIQPRESSLFAFIYFRSSTRRRFPLQFDLIAINSVAQPCGRTIINPTKFVREICPKQRTHPPVSKS